MNFFEDYSKKSIMTLQKECDNLHSKTMYGIIGLIGELGELREAAEESIIDRDVNEKVMHEIGDVIWYSNLICDTFSLKLCDIIHKSFSVTSNLDKCFEKISKFCELVKKEVIRKGVDVATEDMRNSCENLLVNIFSLILKEVYGENSLTFLSNYSKMKFLKHCAEKNLQKLEKRYPEVFYGIK